MVPRRGLEPPRPCERQHLKLVRLPIPPSGHGMQSRNRSAPGRSGPIAGGRGVCQRGFGSIGHERSICGETAHCNAGPRCANGPTYSAPKERMAYGRQSVAGSVDHGDRRGRVHWPAPGAGTAGARCAAAGGVPASRTGLCAEGAGEPWHRAIRAVRPCQAGHDCPRAGRGRAGGESGRGLCRAA